MPVSRDKINILFVIMQMAMGGSERLVHNLVLKMDRTRFSPSVAWFYGESIVPEFKELAVPLYHVTKQRRVDFSSMRMIANIIKQKNIHIVNSHHFMPMVYTFYGSKIRNRAKLIYTEHSEWEMEQLSRKWIVAGTYLLRHADAAIGVSDAVSKRLRMKFKMEKSRAIAIRNGVDLKAFERNGNTAGLRRQFGFTHQDVVIGVVANFRRVKNHGLLLKAFQQLVPTHNNIKLVLIGRGFDGDPENTETELRKFVQTNALDKNILFFGYRPDIPALLNILDIFCLPSFREGLPISLIEAMAAGLPTVGADVEGIRDVVIPNKTGYLVSPHDVRALENTLDALIRNDSLRYQLGREAESVARERYSLDRCVQEYERLFLTLTNS